MRRISPLGEFLWPRIKRSLPARTLPASMPPVNPPARCSTIASQCLGASLRKSPSTTDWVQSASRRHLCTSASLNSSEGNEDKTHGKVDEGAGNLAGHVASSSISSKEQELLAWMEGKLLMKPSRAAGIYEYNKAWLDDMNIEEDLEPCIEMLLQRLSMKGREEAQKFVARNISVLSLEPPKLDAIVEKLKTILGCDERTAIARIKKSPKLLTTPCERLREVWDWLGTRLSLDDQSRRDIIAKNPSLLTVSVDDRLEPYLSWMEQVLNFSTNSVAELVKKFPHRIGNNSKRTSEMKIVRLQERIHLSSEEAIGVLSHPRVVWLGLSNLEPKLSFFLDDMKASPADVKDVLLKDPQILALDLSSHVKPRVAKLQETGVEFDFKEHARCVTLLSDEVFQGTIKKTIIRQRRKAEMERRAKVKEFFARRRALAQNSNATQQSNGDEGEGTASESAESRDEASGKEHLEDRHAARVTWSRPNGKNKAAGKKHKLELITIPDKAVKSSESVTATTGDTESSGRERYRRSSYPSLEKKGMGNHKSQHKVEPAERRRNSITKSKGSEASNQKEPERKLYGRRGMPMGGSKPVSKVMEMRRRVATRMSEMNEAPRTAKLAVKS